MIVTAYPGNYPLSLAKWSLCPISDCPSPLTPTTNTNKRNKVSNHRRAIDRFLVSRASDHKSLVRDIFSETEAGGDTTSCGENIQRHAVKSTNKQF